MKSVPQMTLAKALQNLVAHICLVHASKWRSFGPIRNNSPKMVPSNPNCQLPDELLLPRLIHTFFFFLHLDVVDKTGRFCADWWNWCQRGGAWNLFRNFKLVEDFLRILFRFIKQCRHDDDNIAGHLLLRLGLVWTNHLIGLRQVRASELADSGRLKPKRADNFRRESLRYGRALFWRSYTWK